MFEEINLNLKFLSYLYIKSGSITKRTIVIAKSVKTNIIYLDFSLSCIKQTEFKVILQNYQYIFILHVKLADINQFKEQVTIGKYDLIHDFRFCNQSVSLMLIVAID